METSDVNIRYWALYSHIYSYIEQSGNIKNAYEKYRQLSDVVLYFHKHYVRVTNKK